MQRLQCENSESLLCTGRVNQGQGTCWQQIESGGALSHRSVSVRQLSPLGRGWVRGQTHRGELRLTAHARLKMFVFQLSSQQLVLFTRFTRHNLFGYQFYSGQNETASQKSWKVSPQSVHGMLEKTPYNSLRDSLVMI